MGKVVRNALATVLVGALLGFVVMSLGGPLIQEMQWFGNRESAEARRYMIGILENEPDTLASLTPRGDLEKPDWKDRVHEPALAPAAMTPPLPGPPAPGGVGPLRPPLERM